MLADLWDHPKKSVRNLGIFCVACLATTRTFPKKMKIAIFLILTLLLSSESFAAKWEASLTSPGLVVSIDKERVIVEGSYIVTWQQWIYDQDQTFQNFKYRKSENLIYSDCVNGTSANVQWSLYDNAGAIVYSKRNPMFGFAPPIPGSDREQMHKRVCATINIKSLAKSTPVISKNNKDPYPFEVEKFRSGMSYEEAKNLVEKMPHRHIVPTGTNNILSLGTTESEPMPLIALFFCEGRLIEIETTGRASNFEKFVRLVDEKRKELGSPVDVWTHNKKKDIKPSYVERGSNSINVSWRNGTDIVSVKYTKFENNDAVNIVHSSPNECLAAPGNGESSR